MADADLRFLGERIDRIQAELRDLRGLRAEVARIGSEVAHVRAEMIERHDSLSERLDNLGRAMDIRFDQLHQTMATNLAVVLEAIRERKS